MPYTGFFLNRAVLFIRRFLIGLVTGLLTGALCAFIAASIRFLTSLRELYPQIPFFLPLGGLLIVFLYSFKSDAEDRGANLVLETARDGTALPIHKVPEIFCGTLLSHLFGASVGRFGAGLQISGNLSYNLAKFLHLDENDCRIAATCGMGSAFSVLFSSPLAGAFFGMEVPQIGHFYYPALLPAMVSSLTAFLAAQALGMVPFTLLSAKLPQLSVPLCVCALLLAFCGALLSVIYCRILRFAGSLHRRFSDRPYLRTFCGSLLFVALYALISGRLFGGNYYHGSGLDLIPFAVAGSLPRFAFVFKILFCALSVASGFKGGEIGPALFSAASFGYLCASVLQLSPSLCAGICMSAMMAGITNCPVSALFFSLSLYGYHGAPFWLIGVVVGYACSGTGSLYATQKLDHTK